MSEKEPYESNRRGPRGSRGRGRGGQKGGSYSIRHDLYGYPDIPRIESNWTEAIDDFD